MAKPDWKDAPEWAQYLAQDISGEWWWYECEPTKKGDSFVNSVKQYERAIVANWGGTLEQRPASKTRLDELKEKSENARITYMNAKALGIDGDALDRIRFAYSDAVADYCDAVHSHE